MPTRGIVRTIKAKCRRCYTCIRGCPAKAIKVEEGQAKVLEERCITCGNCVKVCSQSAKEIYSEIELVKELLQDAVPVFATLAPSFPIPFHPAKPRQIVTALRKLGFQEVLEVAFGAQLLGREYYKLFKEGRQRTVISTPCPAVVFYIEKYLPSLIPYLAPLVSPMIALGRVIKQKYRPQAKVVFIGPCIAKKAEMRDPPVASAVDAVLTYDELRSLFAQDGIELTRLPETDFDGPRPGVGRLFPVSAGLLKTAALRADILENNIMVVGGKDNVLQILSELSQDAIKVEFLDILFCEGCINGPIIGNGFSRFSRKEIVTNYVRHELTRQRQEDIESFLDEYACVDLHRGFTNRAISLPIPGQKEVKAILRRIKKLGPDNELNCAACGYPTCREKAIAVYQGLAEAEMCLPYLIDQLEESLKAVQKFSQELERAQTQLIQKEKLASVGELAAGVAHELNNPLAAILLYGHLLLEEVSAEDPHFSNLRTITEEADRAKKIVAALLDFARQRKLDLQPTDLNVLLEETLQVLKKESRLENVRLVHYLDPRLPRLLADHSQLQQAFSNLIINACEAMPQGGDLTIVTAPVEDGVLIEFTDTGCGIPEENLSKIFTPFFTTKKPGRGTGLGLALVYAIIKMHGGQISVRSKEGKGSTFSIILPHHPPPQIEESQGLLLETDRREEV